MVTGAGVSRSAPPCSIPRTSARLLLSFDRAGISRGLTNAPPGHCLRTAVRRPVRFLARKHKKIPHPKMRNYLVTRAGIEPTLTA